MKFKSLVPLLVLSSLSSAYGVLTFSVQFSNPPFGGTLSGIADETGSTASGLAWGFLIAESGDDFSNSLVTDLGISTLDGSALADGFRFFNGGVTSIVDFGFEQGVGVIDSSGTVDATAYTPAINSGDSFALIWFERGFSAGDTLQVGDNYGILTDASFVVPADGASLEPLAPNFVGADPVRSATLTVQAIPEPSSVFLVLVSSSLFLLRRRT